MTIRNKPLSLPQIEAMLQRTQSTIGQLQAQAKKQQQELQETLTKLAALQGASEIKSRSVSNSSHPHQSPTLKDALVELLRSSKGPMRLKDLTSAIMKQRRVRSWQMRKNIMGSIASTMSSNSKVFKRVKKGSYKLL